MSRMVVLLCGPPGAGKTTTARASDLQVYDRDDDHWLSDRQFNEALRSLGRDLLARAVVIRSGASSSARSRAAAWVRPTHTFMVMEDRRECGRRIALRGRADAVHTHAALRGWFASFDRDDGVQDFPGWSELDVATDDVGLGAPSREW